MKNKIFMVLFALVVSISGVLAASYTVDGDLEDWGLNDNDIRVGLCELNNGTNTCSNSEATARQAWKPSHSTVDYVVENNRDPEQHGQPSYFTDLASNFSATGIHIKGKGANQQDYDEPVTNPFNVLEPVFGEQFDIEAIYFDNDENNAYFAIITSMPPGIIYDGEDPYWMGDLEIKVLNPFSYTYGIVLNNHTNYGDGSDPSLRMGDICEEPDWVDGTIIDENGHSHVDECDNIQEGCAEVAYVKRDNIPLEGYSGTDPASGSGIFAGRQDTYVIEVKIPLSCIGNPDPSDGKVIVHSSLSCGNDVIDLSEEETPFDFGFEIPEMGTVAAGTALAIGAVGFLRVRKKRLGGK